MATLSFPILRGQHKLPLVTYIVSNASSATKDRLRSAVQEKTSVSSSFTFSGEEVLGPGPIVADRDLDKFLDLPTEDERLDCHCAFHRAISSAGLAMAVCAVCAREVMVVEDGVTWIALKDLPNRQRLRPRQPHFKQELIQGLLFERKGVLFSENVTLENEDPMDEAQLSICHDCLRSLCSPMEVDRPPKLSLTNGTWIGPIPAEYRVLSFAEKLLISHLYTRVYIFNLTPRKMRGGTGRGVRSLQSGMKGSVTTYKLNMDNITQMLHGDLLRMPRPPSILAKLIMITYVGVGELPKKKLEWFQVQQQAVLNALIWAKENNPRYYGHIVLDEGRLNNLPVDDVPDEISSIIRQNTDVGIIDEEIGGCSH